MAVRLSALGAGRFFPQEDSWYSFLLEAESTSGPQCDWSTHKRIPQCCTEHGILSQHFVRILSHLVQRKHRMFSVDITRTKSRYWTLLWASCIHLPSSCLYFNKEKQTNWANQATDRRNWRFNTARATTLHWVHYPCLYSVCVTVRWERSEYTD
jgi:hypothetical protein